MATATRMNDAITLLKNDHKKVRDLFDQFEKARNDDKKHEIAMEAMKELKVHAVIEEEIFYPAVRENIDDEDLLDEAAEEHRLAKTLIEELSNGGNEHFEAKFTVLAESVRHHIKEEESEMFKQVRESDLDLEALGEEMMLRKEELMASDEELEEAVESSEVQPYQKLGSSAVHA